METLKHSWLLKALAPLIFAVLVFGPLGICCHEHEHGHDRATPNAARHMCIGICVCHFSFTVGEEAALAAAPARPAFDHPRDERQPRAQYVPGIDHPPKIIA